MIKCPSCGRENAENFNFCLDCGYDLKAFRDNPDAEALPSGPMDLSSPASFGGENIQDDSVVPSGPVDLATGQPLTPGTKPPAAAAAPSAPDAGSSPPAAAAGDDSSCPSCGTPNGPEMKFCGNCGARLAADAAGAPQAPAGGRTMFMHAADLNAPAEKVCKLVTIDQTGKEGMTFSLKKGDTPCGRVNGVILFYDDPFVSPSHCQFHFDGNSLKVEDLGSLNGLYRRITDETSVQEGDLLRIGRQLFRFADHVDDGGHAVRPEGDDAKVWGSPNPDAFGRLVQILEDGHAGEVRLLSGEACLLGREQGQLVFPTDGFVSSRHCSFQRQGDGVSVKDLGSSNGTYIRIKEQVELQHGDFILVGNQMLRVEVV